ncbi:hypothetical protein B0H12DRAFT_1078592 [Mycena haematopus]|nr:hypothetical protein B0H12DRAFT_1078592 [Mycena haematopus]
MYCSGCGTNVRVGFGGKGNLQQHIVTGSCAKIQEAKLKKKKPIFASLSSFFPKRSASAALVPSTVSAPHPVQGAVIETLSDPEGTGPNPDHEPPASHSESLMDGSSPPLEPCPGAQRLMRQLRAKIGNIPVHTPLADSTHPLAIFATTPYRDCSPTEDWHVNLHPLLQHAFGTGGLDPSRAAEYINIGEYGLTSFCDFFDHFIIGRGLRGHRIEPYFNFLLNAIELRFPTARNAAGPQPDPAEVRDELHGALPIASEDYEPEDQHVKPCGGLQIRFPPGRSPHLYYPFGLHQQYELPWNYYSHHDQFFIQSPSCLRSLVAPDRGCSRCEGLLIHDVLRGIIQHIAELESYPSDDEDLDSIDGSESPDGGSGVDSNSKVPLAASPSGVDAFGADASSSSSAAVGAPADWDRPFEIDEATRVRCKRRVYDTHSGCGLCGKLVTEAEQADSKLAVRCTMAGCETEWYHRGCFAGEQFTKTWKCPSCSPAKRHRK